METSILPVVTGGPEETEAVGERLGQELAPGAIVALYGDLGAGKTCLVRGLSRAFGIDRNAVSSPSFAIVNEYHGAKGTIFHFDAYRLRRKEEFFELGYEDYFFGDGISVVEWPENVEDLLPEGTIRLRLTHLGQNSRRIERI